MNLQSSCWPEPIVTGMGVGRPQLLADYWTNNLSFLLCEPLHKRSEFPHNMTAGFPRVNDQKERESEKRKCQCLSQPSLRVMPSLSLYFQ